MQVNRWAEFKARRTEIINQYIKMSIRNKARLFFFAQIKQFQSFRHMSSNFKFKVDARRQKFKVKFLCYKFLTFFRDDMTVHYGCGKNEFEKRHHATLRHAFTAGALIIKNSFESNQVMMRSNGNIDEYLERL